MIQVTPENNPAQLLSSLLAWPDCYEVSNVRLSGLAGQSGVFSNGLATVGLDQGIILSTGNVTDAIGPNNLPNTTTDFNRLVNDPDLVILSGGGGGIYDAVSLEFDFTPTDTGIVFSYVFASEEYCEYAASPFNDIFGFFLSGPGINGAFTNNAANIALVPGSNTPVGINTVNHLVNSVWYRNNVPNGMSPGCSNTQGLYVNFLEYDGLTTVLQARATVIPCETYHIKIIIADKSEGAYDSAIFLSANSFRAGKPVQVSAQVNQPATDSLSVYEGCAEAFFRFERTDDDLSEALVVPFSLHPASSAVPGSDYAPLPPSVTIPVGQRFALLPVQIFSDQAAEGVETIRIQMRTACSCQVREAEIRILDPPPLVLSVSDTTICRGTPFQLAPSVSGGVPGYAFLWSTGDTSAQLTGTLLGAATYSVTISDRCGQSLSASVQVLVNQLSLSADATPPSCYGRADGRLLILANGGRPPYQYAWNAPGLNTAQRDGLAAGSYAITVSDADGCSGVLASTLTEPAPILASVVLQPARCEGDSGQITIQHLSGGILPLRYSVDGGRQFANSGAFVGLLPGDYEVLAVDAAGCAFAQNVQLPAPPTFTLSLPGVIELPFGRRQALQSTLSVAPGNIASVQWTPAQGLSCTDCLTPELHATQSRTYHLMVQTLDGCIATDSITIAVDKRIAVFAPTAFTPYNSDGINDRFTLFADPDAVTQIVYLRIFERWGGLVFERHAFPPNNLAQGWDGRARSGKLISQGVYVWTAELQWVDGSITALRGEVVIVE